MITLIILLILFYLVFIGITAYLGQAIFGNDRVYIGWSYIDWYKSAFVIITFVFPKTIIGTIREPKKQT